MKIYIDINDTIIAGKSDLNEHTYEFIKSIFSQYKNYWDGVFYQFENSNDAEDKFIDLFPSVAIILSKKAPKLWTRLKENTLRLEYNQLYIHDNFLSYDDKLSHEGSLLTSFFKICISEDRVSIQHAHFEEKPSNLIQTKTKAKGKLEFQIERFVRTSFFQGKIEGFENIVQDVKEIDVLKKIDMQISDYDKLTSYLILGILNLDSEKSIIGLLPKSKEYTDYFSNEELKPYIFIDFHAEKIMKEIIQRFPVKSRYVELLIKYYVIYRKFFYEEAKKITESHDFCILDHKNNEVDYLLTPEDEELAGYPFEKHNEDIYKIIDRYPISLRMSADMAKSDIIEYVNSNWKYIKLLQNKYKIVDSKYKMTAGTSQIDRDIQKRNDLIYSMRDLPRQEIVNKLLELSKSAGDIYDMVSGAVGKIISLEEELRE